MQIGRLFEIVYILLNKKKVTAKELAQRFEVSVRTVYRDIDALGAAGIPVYTIQGAGGGIFLDDDFVLNKSLLSSGEQEQILLALQSLNATAHLEAGDLLDRLGNIFQKNNTDWIEVDFTRWGALSSDREKFDLLTDAVVHGKVLAFLYAGADKQAGTRTVSPVRLCFKSRSWYLYAYCHTRGDYRLFKLTRMTDLALTGDSFNKDQLPETLPLSDEPVSMPTITVTMRFHPSAAYRLLDEFDPLEIQRQPDGCTVITRDFPDDQWLYSYILSFGLDVEVLEPASVRTRLHHILRKLQKTYE